MVDRRNTRLGILGLSVFVVLANACSSDAESEPTPVDETGSDTSTSDTSIVPPDSTSDSPIDSTTPTDTTGTDTTGTDTTGTDTTGIDTTVVDTGTVVDSGTGVDTSVTDSGTGVDATKSDTSGDTSTGTAPTIGGCPIFTGADAWNKVVTSDPVDATWTTKLSTYATLKFLHPDFGSGFGIPFNVVPNTQPKLTMSFTYASESDPGPYPFPGGTAKIEGGTPTACSGDCHVLSLQQTACLLFEGWDCHFTSSTSSWKCGSGAKFDLTKDSYGQRPLGWTSADAAGLAVLPGLVKYSEVVAGSVNHAIRFTMHCTQDGYVYPASHQAVPSACGSITTATLRANYPPMGLRIRLKSSYVISGMPTQARIVAQAMKTYGMILADNGSDYYFQGDDDSAWNDSQLNALKAIPGDQFEVLTPGTISR